MRMLFSLVLLAVPALAQLSFTDQTVQAGIDFVHVGGGKDKGRGKGDRSKKQGAQGADTQD